jgi:hypothetical protein
MTSLPSSNCRDDWNDDDWRAIRMIAKPSFIVFAVWLFWRLLNALP